MLKFVNKKIFNSLIWSVKPLAFHEATRRRFTSLTIDNRTFNSYFKAISGGVFIP